MTATCKKPIFYAALIALFIIADQLSKWWILEYIFKPELEADSVGLMAWYGTNLRLPFVSVELLPFFNLTMVWNQGISFGLFQTGNPWPLTILSVLISGFFAIWLIKTKNCIEALSISMVIGGALGNVIDRLHFGAVADFFDFHINDWHYPAFNIADSLISVGIVILVVNSLFFNPDKKESANQ